MPQIEHVDKVVEAPIDVEHFELEAQDIEGDEPKTFFKDTKVEAAPDFEGVSYLDSTTSVRVGEDSRNYMNVNYVMARAGISSVPNFDLGGLLMWGLEAVMNISRFLMSIIEMMWHIGCLLVACIMALMPHVLGYVGFYGVLRWLRVALVTLLCLSGGVLGATAIIYIATEPKRQPHSEKKWKEVHDKKMELVFKKRAERREGRN